MNDTVSLSKAIAIMSMVLGHAAYNTHMEQIVNVFHVPLFFFMSGYCFKDIYIQRSKEFFTKRIKGLYIPYVKWGLLFLILHNVLFKVGVYSEEYGYLGVGTHLYSIDDTLHLAKSVFLMKHAEPLLGGYWFITSLFAASILFYFFLRLLGKKNLLKIGVILLLVSILLNYYRIFKWIFSYREFMAAFFMWAGYMYKTKKMSLHRYKCVYVLGLILVFYNLLFIKGCSSDISYKYQVQYIISALVCIVSVFGICEKLLLRCSTKYMNPLLFIGNNTLTILTWHFSLFIIVSQIIVAIYGLPQARIAEFPVIEEVSKQGWYIAYYLFSIMLCVSFAYCNKYIKTPFLKL
ncbi:MAG: acyltransferase family protein [Bacteroidaceae bacterium]|nr:acyltransferase family protein [Bacteroidaceae bacterium]